MDERLVVRLADLEMGVVLLVLGDRGAALDGGQRPLGAERVDERLAVGLADLETGRVVVLDVMIILTTLG